MGEGGSGRRAELTGRGLAGGWLWRLQAVVLGVDGPGGQLSLISSLTQVVPFYLRPFQ